MIKEERNAAHGGEVVSAALKRPILTLKRPVVAPPVAPEPVEVAVAAPATPVRFNPWQLIAELQERWPLAFPSDPTMVRPLMRGVARTIAKEMGWSKTRVHLVMNAWTLSTAYCHAMLDHAMRYDLDGTPVEAVSDIAVEMAVDRLVNSGRLCRWPRIV